jgi:hypothetical protein
MTQIDFEAKVAQIRTNLKTVKANIACAAEKSGRNPEEIKLVGVTKLMPLETIRAGIEASIRCFGENYPEKAAEKIQALGTDQEIEWHMIGHIQSRKADTVCKYFDMVHSVDRLKIARYLDRHCREMGKVMPVLIEVNLSGEDSKYGWHAWDEGCWFEMLFTFREIINFPNIEVRGLMSMPPFFDDPELTRPIYKKLRRLQQFLREELPEAKWEELSIGTSFDYEVAVEEGATMVRVGTDIFGPRPNS